MNHPALSNDRPLRAGCERGKTMLSRRYCVAVAEDDEEMRRLIVEDLEREGHEVLELRDGGELVTYVHAAGTSDPAVRRADLLVTDVRMPHCSGLEAMELLDMIHSTLPSIVITGFGDQQVRDRARELGATTVLDKPFVLQHLRSAVFAALAALDCRAPHSEVRASTSATAVNEE